MPRSKRWSARVPEEKIAPAGSVVALTDAKAELGPFEAKHSIDQVCRCGRCADTKILALARRFNKLRFGSKGAPRARHVTRNLQDVAVKSRQLVAALCSLDDYSRDWLRKPRGPAVGRPDLRLLFNKASAKELPPPSTIGNGDGEFVARLKALSQYADLMATEFEVWRIHNAPFPIADKGGNTNIITQWHGRPTEILVIGAYHIYDDFRPGEARKTENGSFHSFVDHVFHYATGSRRGQSTILSEIKRLLGRNGVLRLPK